MCHTGKKHGMLSVSLRLIWFQQHIFHHRHTNAMMISFQKLVNHSKATSLSSCNVANFIFVHEALSSRLCALCLCSSLIKQQRWNVVCSPECCCWEIITFFHLKGRTYYYHHHDHPHHRRQYKRKNSWSLFPFNFFKPKTLSFSSPPNTFWILYAKMLRDNLIGTESECGLFTLLLLHKKMKHT